MQLSHIFFFFLSTLNIFVVAQNNDVKTLIACCGVVAYALSSGVILMNNIQEDPIIEFNSFSSVVSVTGLGTMGAYLMSGPEFPRVCRLFAQTGREFVQNCKNRLKGYKVNGHENEGRMEIELTQETNQHEESQTNTLRK